MSRYLTVLLFNLTDFYFGQFNFSIQGLAICNPVHSGVYLSVRTCELFLCFVTIVRVRVY